MAGAMVAPSGNLLVPPISSTNRLYSTHCTFPTQRPRIHSPPPTVIDLERQLIGAPSPANLPLPRLLRSCAVDTLISTGRQLHALTYKLNLARDPYIQTSLLHMYATCSRLDLALLIFHLMPHRTTVAWTAAVDACLRCSEPELALEIFREMVREGAKMDGFTLVSILGVCARLGKLELGVSVHGCLEKTGAAGRENTLVFRTALIDMYCKCGKVDDAARLFDAMPMRSRSVQIWNAMLHGLSLHGLGTDVVKLFSVMEQQQWVQPNEVTFVALLFGCAHCGLVYEGRHYFEMMRQKYGIEPSVKHYGCMVDLLGRAGLLAEALEVACRAPLDDASHIVWGALLSACRLHNNIDMAELVMERLDRGGHQYEDTSHYVIMADMYMKARLSEKQAMVRRMVGKKPKGRSWVSIGAHENVF